MSNSATVADTIVPPSRHKKSAEYQIPYSREALRQDLARVRVAWDEFRPVAIATRSTAISARCSTW